MTDSSTKAGYGKLLAIMYKLYGKESTATENDSLDLP